MNPLEQLKKDAGAASGAWETYNAVKTFIAEWEAVEVDLDGGIVTILVPRKAKPTLLEAAEAVEAWCRCTNHWRGMPKDLHQKCDTLATAIQKERDNE